jgi:ribonuclease HII
LTAEPPEGLLGDSKKLSRARRLAAFEWLQENSLYVVEIAAVNHISLCGVYKARNAAARRAAEGLIALLETQDVCVVIDGNPFPLGSPGRLWQHSTQVKFIVRADETVPEVSAASIIAKTYTDALFDGWGRNWAGYGMERDHGSPSTKHKDALRKQGPSPLHRTHHYGADWWKQLLGTDCHCGSIGRRYPIGS